MRISIVLVSFVGFSGVTAAAPDYDALVPGQWTVISSNTIESLDPCPTRDCSYSGVEGGSSTEPRRYGL